MVSFYFYYLVDSNSLEFSRSLVIVVDWSEPTRDLARRFTGTKCCNTEFAFSSAIIQIDQHQWFQVELWHRITTTTRRCELWCFCYSQCLEIGSSTNIVIIDFVFQWCNCDATSIGSFNHQFFIKLAVMNKKNLYYCREIFLKSQLILYWDCHKSRRNRRSISLCRKPSGRRFLN